MVSHVLKTANIFLDVKKEYTLLQNYWSCSSSRGDILIHTLTFVESKSVNQLREITFFVYVSLSLFILG